MAEKGFLNWVGFKGDVASEQAPSSVERIRELEAQLADLRSRRDITALSKEEFEILATETAMTMIRSAQLRESRAQASADRLLNETTRQAKDVLEAAESKARTILNGAEARGRKYISAAEEEASEIVTKATREAENVADEKRREITALASAARREGERIISEATADVAEYRQWLAGVIQEAERLYRIQTQSLDAATQAIEQSRSRLEGAYGRLSELHKRVEDSIDAHNKPIKRGPIVVESQRTKPALEAPKKTSAKAVTGKKQSPRTKAKKKSASRK